MPRKILHKVIFQARNIYGKERGQPPQWDTSDDSTYSAYFENEFREQLIFAYSYSSHTALLWLSKKGWEHPFQVVDGKAQNAGLSRSEKKWLAACWNAATTIDQRREHHRKQLAEQQLPDQPVEPSIAPHEETVDRMGRLYDGLAQTGIAPDCSRTEFVSGWAGFLERIAELEAKDKTQLEANESKS